MPPGAPAAGRKFALPVVIWASKRLNSPKITSSSDSCVSTKFAIDIRYEWERTDAALALVLEAPPSLLRSLNLRNFTPAYAGDEFKDVDCGLVL